MITILIANDEQKVKDALAKLLQQEGYVFSESLGAVNITKVIKEGSANDLTLIKDKVIELEGSLFNEKKGVLYKSILEAVEKPLIEQTLERTEGNQLKAARILGINRNTMRTKIKKLGIDVTRWKINQ